MHFLPATVAAPAQRCIHSVRDDQQKQNQSLCHITGKARQYHLATGVQDEEACIGCTMCVSIAPGTFRLEGEHGRSRVFAQWANTEDETQVCPAARDLHITLPQSAVCTDIQQVSFPETLYLEVK